MPCAVYVCYVTFVVLFSDYFFYTPPPRSSQKNGEGGEEEEEVAVEVMCLPPSGYDLELYNPELLYHHRPIEAPVSPRKCIVIAKHRKKMVFTLLTELQIDETDIVSAYWSQQCSVLVAFT